MNTLDIAETPLIAETSNNIYEKVVIAPIYKLGNRETNKYLVSSVAEYKNALKEDNNFYELIGGKSQIKPCFDCEAYYNVSTTDEDRLKEKFNSCKNHGLNKCSSLFPNKPVKISYRPIRKVIHNNDLCYKISFHYIVQGVRISCLKLGQLLENESLKTINNCYLVRYFWKRTNKKLLTAKNAILAIFEN